MSIFKLIIYVACFVVRKPLLDAEKKSIFTAAATLFVLLTSNTRRFLPESCPCLPFIYILESLQLVFNLDFVSNVNQFNSDVNKRTKQCGDAGLFHNKSK